MRTTRSLFYLTKNSTSSKPYDFVIVGAGSAGCVVSNRLSADGRHSVLLVEAGGRDSYPWIHIPVGYFKTMGNPRTDWSYPTQPDDGLNGRSIIWPRGKGLGGSSSINGLLYVRGQSLDFDHWRQLGNQGWAWRDVLPYFKKAESWEDGANDSRGGDGPLSVSKTRFTHPVIDAWLAAATAAGYPATADYNGENQEGVGYYQMTTRNGRRASAAVAYLRPAKNRSNLDVITDAQAERLHFEGKRVTGVSVRTKSGVSSFTANKEVILSAGTIASPQLLLLSGIGAPTQLQAHGISVQHVLEGVGENLQDHLQARPIFHCSVPTINTEAKTIIQKAFIGLRYALNRSGPMAMAASLGAAFCRTRPELETPDVQFHIQPFSKDTLVDDTHEFSAFTASVCQLRPESTGRLTLTCADVKQYPAIEPNYLSTQTDRDTLVEGIRIARRINQFEPLKSIVGTEHAPGPEVSNEHNELLDWARSSSTTIFHPTGTCKMGSDAMAVVDERLRVHGVPGLRVADCSIMPRIVSGNTNAAAIMIGEKASAMILEDTGRA